MGSSKVSFIPRLLLFTLGLISQTHLSSITLYPLVSLFGRFVARGGRKCGNRHTHRQTDTDQLLYPSSTCTPRVNKDTSLNGLSHWCSEQRGSTLCIAQTDLGCEAS